MVKHLEQSSSAKTERRTVKDCLPAWSQASPAVRRWNFQDYLAQAAEGQDADQLRERLDFGLKLHRNPEKLRLLTWALVQFTGELDEATTLQVLSAALSQTQTPLCANPTLAVLDTLAQTLRVLALGNFTDCYWNVSQGCAERLRISTSEPPVGYRTLLMQWRQEFFGFVGHLSSRAAQRCWYTEAAYQLTDIKRSALVLLRLDLTGRLVCSLANEAATGQPSVVLSRQSRHALRLFEEAWSDLQEPLRQQLVAYVNTTYSQTQKPAFQLMHAWLSAWLLAGACNYDTASIREQVGVLVQGTPLADHYAQIAN